MSCISKTLCFMFCLTFVLLLFVAVVFAAPPSELYPIVSGYTYPTDIARDPNDIPKEPLANGATVTITAQEIEAFIAPADPTLAGPKWNNNGTDVKFKYFAFGGGHSGQDQTPRVPGPFIRVKEGNTVTIKLVNNGTETHSIDFHAVLGMKGGAAMLLAGPGQTASLTATLNYPGIFVYHCTESGTPLGIAEHMNQGMFGLMLVEPKKGGDFKKLTKNSTEFYVFEQDVFRNNNGEFDEDKWATSLAPDYVVYNGRVGALIDHPLQAIKGKNAIIYHAAAGVHPPSFHIIGEIFDRVFNMGDLQSNPLRNVQTILIPTAGAVMIEMDGNKLIPTNQATGDIDIMVDHGSAYFRKGALGLMLVNP